MSAFAPSLSVGGAAGAEHSFNGSAVSSVLVAQHDSDAGLVGEWIAQLCRSFLPGGGGDVLQSGPSSLRSRPPNSLGGAAGAKHPFNGQAGFSMSLHLPSVLGLLVLGERSMNLRRRLFPAGGRGLHSGSHRCLLPKQREGLNWPPSPHRGGLASDLLVHGDP